MFCNLFLFSISIFLSQKSTSYSIFRIHQSLLIIIQTKNSKKRVTKNPFWVFVLVDKFIFFITSFLISNDNKKVASDVLVFDMWVEKRRRIENSLHTIKKKVHGKFITYNYSLQQKLSSKHNFLLFKT